jgi:hypothetical protein
VYGLTLYSCIFENNTATNTGGFNDIYNASLPIKKLFFLYTDYVYFLGGVVNLFSSCSDSTSPQINSIALVMSPCTLDDFYLNSVAPDSNILCNESHPCNNVLKGINAIINKLGTSDYVGGTLNLLSNIVEQNFFVLGGGDTSTYGGSLNGLELESSNLCEISTTAANNPFFTV